MSKTQARLDKCQVRGSQKVSIVRALALILLAVLSISGSAQPARAQYQVNREIRVTTGKVTVSGWEKSLVDRNPGLKHWTWMPITSYTQGRIAPRQAGPQASASEPQKPRYAKPVHVSTVVARHSYANPYGQVRTQATLDGKISASRNDVAARLTTSQAQGRLASSSVNAQLAAPVTVAAYQDGYGSLIGRHTTHTVRQEVVGKIKGLGRS